MNALFDTNIVIDALNGLPEADAEYLRCERVRMSLITWMEVLLGEAQDDSPVRDFLQAYFEIVPVDFAIAERAIQIRRQYRRIHLPDAMIWATAQVSDAILVTRNTKDFDPRWEGVRVPYQV